ncbi:MAG: hypothetical protein ACOYXT_27300 [Bacteroidota bacterium]
MKVVTNGNRVVLSYPFGAPIGISLTGDSGDVFYRYKVDSITRVKHPGIKLGVGTDGQRYYVHNHYLSGKASIVTEAEFAQGQTIYRSNEPCLNTKADVVRLALQKVNEGKPYHFLSNNCQTTVNEVCNNRSESETVNGWLGVAAFVALVWIFWE